MAEKNKSSSSTKNEQAEERKDDEEEEEDPFEIRIENSGCSKYHYALQVLPWYSLIILFAFNWCLTLMGTTLRSMALAHRRYFVPKLLHTS